jgi:hypothetical protein
MAIPVFFALNCTEVTFLNGSVLVRFVIPSAVHWLRPRLSSYRVSQSRPPLFLKATEFVFANTCNLCVTVLHARPPGLSIIFEPRFSTNNVSPPGKVRPISSRSELPLVKPFAEICPITYTAPDSETLSAYAYSLKLGVPIVRTHCV